MWTSVCQAKALKNVPLAFLGMFSPFVTIQYKFLFWRWWSGFFLTKLLHFQKDAGASRTVLSPSAREELYPRPGSYCCFQLLKPALSSLLPHPSSDSSYSTDGSSEYKTSWRSLHLFKMLPATPCWPHCPSHPKPFGFVQHPPQQYPALCHYHRDLN